MSDGGDLLPVWSEGTVAVLSTIGNGTVHAIPVSTALRAGPLRIVFALSCARGSLERLRDDPRVALTLLGAGNVAITAHGAAAVLRESLAADAHVAAIGLSVERISNHASDDSEVLAGVRWRWLDPRTRAREAQIIGELRSIDAVRDVAGSPAAEGCAPIRAPREGLTKPPTLVVIDVQNGFVNERTRPSLPFASKLIEHWQAKRWPVVFTRFHNPAGSGYERWLAWTGLRADDETALHDVVAGCADTVVDKSIYTAFTPEGEQALAVHAGDTLVICGIDTESCVLKTALDAFERDVRPVIAIDACATDGGEVAQQAARLVLERAVGSDQLMATVDVLARFAAEPASSRPS
jgi:nicotinamidase-related amidase